MLTLGAIILMITFGTWCAGHIDFVKKNQIRQGILFGILAIIANTFSVDVGDLHISVGLIDAPPMIAGLFFGPVAGVLSGAMAAIERAMTPLWGVGIATWGRCSIATFLVSVYAVILAKLVFTDEKPSILSAMIAAAFGEVLHLTLLFIVGMDNLSLTCEIIIAASLPMAVGSGIAAGLATLVYDDWKQWNKKFYATTTRSFLVFGIAFGIIAYMALSIARRDTDATLLHTIDRFEAKVNEHIGFYLHRCAYNISERLGTARPYTVEYMQEIAANEGLDEISLFAPDEKVIASNDLNVLNGTNFSRSNHVSKEFFELIDKQTSVVKQGFRPSISVPSITSCYAGISMPRNDGILQVGYHKNRLDKEFGLFFIPHVANSTILFHGSFLIADMDGTLVSPGRFHPEARGKNLLSIGFMKPDLEWEPKFPFYARLFGDWCRCAKVSIIGPYQIYAILPLRDIYWPMLNVIFISGLALFILCILFRWTILRMIWAQQEVDRLNTLKEETRKKDLELAHKIQISELKEDNPENEFFKINAIMQTAKEVGGDFYDYYDLANGKTIVTIADVAGKGMPAAIFMMKAKTTLRQTSTQYDELTEVYQHANDDLCKNNDAQMFVTAWSAVFDPKTGVLEFVSGGHNPPLICRADGHAEWVKAPISLPLGIRAKRKFHSGKLQLHSGDRLILYTDGVTEAMNAKKEQYSDARLFELINHKKTDDRSCVTELIINDVKKFVYGAEQSDDITILAMKIK